MKNRHLQVKLPTGCFVVKKDTEGRASLPDTHSIRRLLKTDYGALYDRVAEALFFLDPLQFHDDPGMYEPEVDAILLRLPAITSAGDLRRFIWDLFAGILGAQHCGPVDHFDAVAELIWNAYQSEREAA